MLREACKAVGLLGYPLGARTHVVHIVQAGEKLKTLVDEFDSKQRIAGNSSKIWMRQRQTPSACKGPLSLRP